MAYIIWTLFVVVLSLAGQVYSAVNCAATGAGRFPDPSDTTCKNYTICIYKSSTQTYSAYNYACTSTEFFNPKTGLCASNYVCNPAASLCKYEGYIPNPTPNNCSCYIECVKIDDVYIATNYCCPDSTLFNPDSTLCEADYKCPKPAFKCTEAGRFANPADDACKTYFMCVLVSNDGTMKQLNYTCPSTSVFSPSDRFCTTKYTCS
ncbi:hypothetical protein evm_014210 [Chilo suppressalis]|nr:hypothetical protein evm_014210 [Chilo suppressalis]